MKRYIQYDSWFTLMLPMLAPVTCTTSHPLIFIESLCDIFYATVRLLLQNPTRPLLVICWMLHALILIFLVALNVIVTNSRSSGCTKIAAFTKRRGICNIQHGEAHRLGVHGTLCHLQNVISASAAHGILLTAIICLYWNITVNVATSCQPWMNIF